MSILFVSTFRETSTSEHFSLEISTPDAFSLKISTPEHISSNLSFLTLCSEISTSEHFV